MSTPETLERAVVRAHFVVTAAEELRDKARVALDKAKAAAALSELTDEAWFAQSSWTLLPPKPGVGPFADPTLHSATRNRAIGPQITETHSSLATLRRLCESTDARLASAVPLKPADANTIMTGVNHA